jgi:hypothetical protein
MPDELVKEGVIVGQNIAPEQQPINNWDWFKLSRSWIAGSEDRLQKQVDGIQSAIKWFFGLGSSATILTVLLKDPQLEQINIVLLVGALLSLLTSYALSTLSVTMISRSIENPNDANSIRGEFNRVNRKSRIFLVISSSLLLIGMSLFPAAIMLAAKKSAYSQKSYAEFTGVGLVQIIGKARFIRAIDVSGFTPDSTLLTFKLEKGTSIFNTLVEDTFRHILSHSQFDYTFELKPLLALDSTKNYYLTLIYHANQDSIHAQSIKLTFR